VIAAAAPADSMLCGALAARARSYPSNSCATIHHRTTSTAHHRHSAVNAPGESSQSVRTFTAANRLSTISPASTANSSRLRSDARNPTPRSRMRGIHPVRRASGSLILSSNVLMFGSIAPPAWAVKLIRWMSEVLRGNTIGSRCAALLLSRHRTRIVRQCQIA